MKERAIRLLDTTLRDGEQTQGVAFSAHEKVTIARALLMSLRVDRIEVASACVSQGEQAALAEIIAWAESEGMGERVETLGFVDGRRSVDWIAAAGGRVINLLAKGSERHCREQLGKTLASHLDDIARTADYARSVGMAVNMYLEDFSNGFRDSRDYLFGLLAGTRPLGLGHYMLPDTLGLYSPEEVSTAMQIMLGEFPDLEFDFHPHNDYGLATANVLAAAQAGIANIHCTVNCLGERAGNASLAEVVVALRDKLGADLRVDESNIALVSRMVENFSGKWVAANAPVVGSDVFTQTAGIHADGDLKGDLYVSKLAPERFARKRVYALGKLSGKASLIKNLTELGISLSADDQARVLERIVALGDAKQVITSADLPFIIADVMDSDEYRHVRLLNCYVSSGLDVASTASVRLRVGREECQGTGSGNGGFAAFCAALDALLAPHGLELPALVDYEIHIPRGGQPSALTECTVTWRLGDRDIKTRGIHANQVLAGVKAAMRMVNLKWARERDADGVQPEVAK